MLHWRGHTVEIADRPHADIQVQELAQGNVQGTDAASDRGCERTLDPHQEFRESLLCLIGQPGLEELERLLTSVHFHPVELALSTVCFFHRGIENPHRSTPDIAARAVALHERDDRIIGNLKDFHP